MPVRAFSKYKRHVELAYVEDWAYTFHRDSWIWTNAPIGPDLEFRDGKLVYARGEGIKSARRPRADCIIIKPREIWVVEAAVLPHRYPKALGDLILYKPLAPQTPELRKYADRDFKFKLLTPLEHPRIREECLKHGIENVVWMPPLTREYLSQLAPYLRVPPRWGA